MNIRRGVRPSPGAGSGDRLVEPAPRHGARRSPWREVWLVDESTLEVVGFHGLGQGLDHVEIDESVDPVLVTTWIGYDEPDRANWPRRLPGFGFRVRVGLTSPLGDRLVADGALPTPEEHRARCNAAAREWRAELGLPADEATVAALWDAAPEDVRSTGETPLTAGEQAWLDELQRRQDAALDFAAEWCRCVGGSVDGSGWIEWAGGPTWVQCVTRGADELRAAAAAAGIDRLRVEAVEHPYAALVTATNRIARRSEERKEELAASGIRLSQWGPDPKANRVRVEVRGDAETARRILSSMFDPELLIVETIGVHPARRAERGSGPADR